MVSVIPTFHLNNEIGIDALDLPIHPMQSLHGTFDLLVFDPGQFVGWAGVRDGHVEVGQSPWYEVITSWSCQTVYIERTPFAAIRTFDPWPIRFEGIVHSRLYPIAPKFVSPTSLSVAGRWFSLPKGHGLGRHAKDALTHLVGVLVKEAR